MNPKRVQVAINVMKRAKERGDKLYMPFWQEGSVTVKTEEDAHTCGTACCFAGWLAIAPEFHEAGGSVSKHGEPMFQNRLQDAAIAQFLGISETLAGLLTMIADSDDDDSDVNTEFYGVEAFGDVTFDMVIEKLELILKGDLK